LVKNPNFNKRTFSNVKDAEKLAGSGAFGGRSIKTTYENGIPTYSVEKSTEDQVRDVTTLGLNALPWVTGALSFGAGIGAKATASAAKAAAKKAATSTTEAGSGLLTKAVATDAAFAKGASNVVKPAEALVNTFVKPRAVKLAGDLTGAAGKTANAGKYFEGAIRGNAGPTMKVANAPIRSVMDVLPNITNKVIKPVYRASMDVLPRVGGVKPPVNKLFNRGGVLVSKSK
jgi:hypothetical protein